MNGLHETKSEIRARLDELKRSNEEGYMHFRTQSMLDSYEARIAELELALSSAEYQQKSAHEKVLI